MMGPLEFKFWAELDDEDGAWSGRLFVPDEKFLLVTCGASLQETLVRASGSHHVINPLGHDLPTQPELIYTPPASLGFGDLAQAFPVVVNLCLIRALHHK